MGDNHITRPDIRWRIFINVLELVRLKAILNIGTALRDPSVDLVEIREMLFDDACAEPKEGGVALFDEDEFQALKDLAETELDMGELSQDDPQLQLYLSRAEECLRLMMSQGRGMPGWDHQNRDLSSPLY